MNTFEILTNLLNKYTQKHNIGLACGIWHGEDQVYEKNIGYSDINKTRKINEDTIFRIYSMTKMITCAMAMKLHEQGKIDINEPVHHIFPNFRHLKVVKKDELGGEYIEEAKNDLLIKHLIIQTAGYPYSLDNSITGEYINKITLENKDKIINNEITTKEFFLKFSEVPLVFDPGTRWLYGYSHDLLGIIIEEVVGTTLGRCLDETFFQPLGMHNTGFNLPKSKEHLLHDFSFPDGYVDHVFLDNKEKWLNRNNSIELGSGGLLSSLHDYGRFATMMTNMGTYKGKRYLSSRTVELMRTNHLNEQQLKDYESFNKTGYGYGLGVRTLMDKVNGESLGNIGEFGWDGFLATFALCDPASKISVVLMQQCNEEYGFQLHRKLVNTIYGDL